MNSITPPAAVLAFALTFTSSATARLLINEVNIDPPGSDDGSNLEYIEFHSTTGGAESTDGLTLLVVDSNNGGYGKIRQRWSLNGLSTGENGLLVIGNNYPTSFPYGAVAEGTTVGDPASPDAMDNGEIGSNGGLTLFLVSGLLPAVTIDLDLDEDDNGSIDFSPWDELVDSVGYNDTDPADPPNRTSYAQANLSQATFFPENVSRVAGDDRANTSGAWFGGVIPGGGDGKTYDPDRTFNAFPGAGASPGTSNAPLSIADLRLNEISINPNGNDENLEFIEVVETTGSAARTDGYHILLVINDPAEGDPGTIEQAWSLAGLETGENGLLILGDHYGKPVPGTRADTPFKTLVELETAAGDPESWGRNEIEPSDGLSVLLVTGFTGTKGTDLDPANSGTFSVTPWEQIVDSTGFDNVNEITGTVTASAAPGKLPSSSFYPDNLSRLAGNFAANDPAAWYGGDYGGDSQASVAFSENRFFPQGVSLEFPRATPGGRNLSPGSPAYGRDILINEVVIDVPPSPGNSDDGTHEFIELVSANARAEVLEGLWLVIVDTEPGSTQTGVIQQVFGLGGLATGPNGICVIGDSYNDLLVAAPVPFDTNREDPQGLNAGDISPNDGLTVLLVEGLAGLVGQDLDADDDGVFETTPWTTLVDGVGFGMVADPSVAVVAPGFTPDALSRLPSSLEAGDRRSASAWTGGSLAGTPTETAYAAPFFGPFRGGFTRGYGNHAAAPAEPGSVLINEVVVKPASEAPGERGESIEILVTTLDARSLSGYSLVVVESEGGSVGDLAKIWDLSGLATGSNGLLLLGEGYTTSVPFETDPATATGQPLDFESGDTGSGDALSLLLVKDMVPTANEGTDLDASLNPAQDDDGILDFTPWAAVVDSIGFREYDADTSSNVGITYAIADVSQAGEPDALARLASTDHLTANSATAWYGGDFSGSSAYAFPFEESGIFGIAPPAAATPGFHNLGGSLLNPDFQDPDGDGRSTLLETATGTDPAAADAPAAMTFLVVDDGGVNYAAVRFPRIAGGASSGGNYSADGIRYEIESSESLSDWTVLPTVDAVPPSGGSGGAIELATLRSTAPFDPANSTGFLRLRVTREPSNAPEPNTDQ